MIVHAGLVGFGIPSRTYPASLLATVPAGTPNPTLDAMTAHIG